MLARVGMLPDPVLLRSRHPPVLVSLDHALQVVVVLTLEVTTVFVPPEHTIGARRRRRAGRARDERPLARDVPAATARRLPRAQEADGADDLLGTPTPLPCSVGTHGPRRARPTHTARGTTGAPARATFEGDQSSAAGSRRIDPGHGSLRNKDNNEKVSVLPERSEQAPRPRPGCEGATVTRPRGWMGTGMHPDRPTRGRACTRLLGP